jgi:hypothetical protein
MNTQKKFELLGRLMQGSLGVFFLVEGLLMATAGYEVYKDRVNVEVIIGGRRDAK